MTDRIDRLGDLLSTFVTERDNYAARYKSRNTGLFAPGHHGGPFGFSALIDGHAETLSRILPELSLTQWEALSELSASRLAFMRNAQRGGN
jgi:hypothetical protein